jgi:hypothetical protein
VPVNLVRTSIIRNFQLSVLFGHGIYHLETLGRKKKLSHAIIFYSFFVFRGARRAIYKSIGFQGVQIRYSSLAATSLFKVSFSSICLFDENYFLCAEKTNGAKKKTLNSFFCFLLSSSNAFGAHLSPIYED